MRKLPKPGEPREAYSPGQLYTMDEMFQEFEKWRMCAMIYFKRGPLLELTDGGVEYKGEYHCDIFRPSHMPDPYTGQTLPATMYWGGCKGATRYEAMQNAVIRLHRIINEFREDGIDDSEI